MLNLTSPVPDFGPRAACLGLDTELFFPIGEVGPSLPQIARAKDVCAGCPVMAECRAWALEFGPDGIWGGMTAGERLPLRRRARAAARAREAEAEAEPGSDEAAQLRLTPAAEAYLADPRTGVGSRVPDAVKRLAVLWLLGNGLNRTEAGDRLGLNGSKVKKLVETA